MNTEQKAKAYDKAIIKAKELYNQGLINPSLEHIFPELKENVDGKPCGSIVMEDFTGGDGAYKVNLDYLNKKQVEEIEKIVKTWNTKSNDDIIKECVGMALTDVPQSRFESYGTSLKECLAWLEKQGDKDKLIKELGEYKVKYTQEVLEKHLNSMNNKDDERLRKTTIAFLKDFAEKGYENAVECIDWLENQSKQKSIDYNEELKKCLENPLYFICKYVKLKERKSVDKVEPKFHEGEWVVFNNKHQSIYQVEKIENGYYILRHTHGGTFRVCVLHDESLRLWTIEDAKPGDVLVNGSNIFIFHFLNDTRLMGYCHVNTNDGRFYDDIGKNECFCLIDAAVTPATKEQRDLLFQKMKEAGYEWDVENKELKKIEQEDEEYNGEDYGIDSLYHAISILEKTLGEVEGYQSDDGILEHKCAITAVKELYKKKPAEWSKKDEKAWKELIEEVKDQLDSVPAPDCRDKEDEKVLKQLTRWLIWLKSLKNRVQPKQVWSEEDEKNFNDIDITLFEDKKLPKEKYWKIINWLKSLKERIDGEIVVEYDEDELDFGENHSGPLTCGKILNIRRKSYKQGKDDLLNKAVEWLKENLAEETTVLACGSVTINFNNVIEKFKKAMEE